MLHIGRIILNYSSIFSQKKAKKENVIDKDKLRWKLSQQLQQTTFTLKLGYTFYTSVQWYAFLIKYILNNLF